MNEWGGKIFYSHGSQNSCGVAVLIRNGFNCTVKKTIIDPSGRFIVLKVDIEDKAYVLVNIYAPNKDKVTCKFFQNVWFQKISIPPPPTEGHGNSKG